jgi:hypothetical protein
VRIARRIFWERLTSAPKFNSAKVIALMQTSEG